MGLKFVVIGVVHPYLTYEQIENSILSIKKQTLLPTEIIIFVDSNVSPKCEKLILNSDLPINFVQNNFLKKGLGFHLSQIDKYVDKNIDLILRFDFDDENYPNRFETQVKYMQKNPKVDICSSYYVNKFNKRIVKLPVENKKIKKLLPLCPIVHPAVCFRYSKIILIGGYKNIQRHQDLDLWLRSSANGLNFSNIKIPLLVYDPPQKRQKFGDLVLNIKIIWRYQKFLKISFLKLALFSFIIIFKELIPLRIKFILRRFFLLFF